MNHDDAIWRFKLLKERGNKCEICGAKNGSKVIRSKDNSEYITFGATFDGVDWWDYNGITIQHGHPYFDLFDTSKKPIKIALRVAYIDHNNLHNEPSNLKVMCQLHHNRHTSERREKTKKKNRQAKALQMKLEEING